MNNELDLAISKAVSVHKELEGHPEAGGVSVIISQAFDGGVTAEYVGDIPKAIEPIIERHKQAVDDVSSKLVLYGEIAEKSLPSSVWHTEFKGAGSSFVFSFKSKP